MADEIARNVARLTAEADFIISGCERGEITGNAASCDHDRCAGSRRKNGRTTCGFKVEGDRVAYETLMKKPLSKFKLFGSAVEYASRPPIPHTPPPPSPTLPPRRLLLLTPLAVVTRQGRRHRSVVRPAGAL